MYCTLFPHHLYAVLLGPLKCTDRNPQTKTLRLKLTDSEVCLTRQPPPPRCGWRTKTEYFANYKGTLEGYFVVEKRPDIFAMHTRIPNRWTTQTVTTKTMQIENMIPSGHWRVRTLLPKRAARRLRWFGGVEMALGNV